MDVLRGAALDDAIRGLDWQVEGEELVRTVERQDFAHAMVLVNAVAEAAESVDHHPDIDIRWNKVTFRLSTHTAGGITRHDVRLAELIDGLLTADEG